MEVEEKRPGRRRKRKRKKTKTTTAAQTITMIVRMIQKKMTAMKRKRFRQQTPKR